MSKYDIFDFEIVHRKNKKVILIKIKLERPNEFYYLGFFTDENIEKLKKVIEEYENL